MVSHIFDDFFLTAMRNTSNFPPANAYADSDGNLTVELAVAGFTEDELDVTFENSTLTVTGKHENTDDRNYIVRGIAARTFTRSFDVRGTYDIGSADLNYGILTIRLQNVSERKKIKVLTHKR